MTTRRVFLKTVASCTAVGICGVGCGSGTPTAASSEGADASMDGPKTDSSAASNPDASPSGGGEDASVANPHTSDGGPLVGFAAGNASALAVGSLRAVVGSEACIARDANGIYAMSLICTHQGCDMSTYGFISPNSIMCRCHGSTFDPNGNVITGPANSPLPHFKVSEDAAGNLAIDTNTEVDPNTRLA